MAHYIIATIEIADRQEYAKYEADFMHVFAKFDGTMLAVDESATALEGDWPDARTVLISFPSADAAMAWYRSAEYQEIAKHRVAASTGNVALLEGF